MQLKCPSFQAQGAWRKAAVSTAEVPFSGPRRLGEKVTRKFWGENGSYKKVWWKMAVTGKLENGIYCKGTGYIIIIIIIIIIIWGKMAVSIENTKAVHLKPLPDLLQTGVW